jgi:hypothetical protein
MRASEFLIETKGMSQSSIANDAKLAKTAKGREQLVKIQKAREASRLSAQRKRERIAVYNQLETSTSWVKVYHADRTVWPKLDITQCLPIDVKEIIYFAVNNDNIFQYGNNEYECYVNLGKNASLLPNSPLIEHIINKFTISLENKEKLNFLLTNGRVWRLKKLERKIYNYLWSQGYNSIWIVDEIEDDGAENEQLYTKTSETSKTLVVRNNGKNVKIIRKL